MNGDARAPVSAGAARVSNEAMAARARHRIDARNGASAAAVLGLIVVLLAIALRASAAGSGATPATPANDCCGCPAPTAAPIAMRPSEEDDGWELSFDVPTYDGYTDAFLRFDERPETNLGHEHWLDVMTGRPFVRTWTILPPEWVTPGAHRVALRLVRRDGRATTRTFSLDAAKERLALAKRELSESAEQVISFAEHGDEITWLGFGRLYDHRRSLREIHYSVDGCGLGSRIVFSADPDAEPTLEPRPAQDNDLILDRPFLSLPKATTKSACVQAIFSDGTRSRVFELHRQPSGGKER